MRTEEKPKVKPIEVTALAAGKRFGLYKDEALRAIREADFKKDERLCKLIEIWKEADYTGKTVGSAEDFYFWIKVRAGKLDFSAVEVEKLSLALIEFEKKEEGFSIKMGVFLSALIKIGKDENYTIQTVHLDGPLDYIGFRNEKNVRVNGDVDVRAGQWMKAGNLVINGNAGDLLGNCLRGGRIVVAGNAGHDIGEEMNGGSIEIFGNSGRDVGSNAICGDIHLHGDYESISEYAGLRTSSNDTSFWLRKGKLRIFHKGKLIVDK